jgi:hypothetical protein
MSSLQELARTDPAGGRPGTAPTAEDGRRCWEWLEKMNKRMRKKLNRKIYKKKPYLKFSLFL